MPARRQKVVGVLMVSKVRLVFVLLVTGVVGVEFACLL